MHQPHASVPHAADGQDALPNRLICSNELCLNVAGRTAGLCALSVCVRARNSRPLVVLILTSHSAAARVTRPARPPQVLLPTAPGTDVPEWFFDRTGGDLKAEFQRTRAAREQRETLMTRAWREKLAQAGRKQHKFATVRVRFPEGVLLQGAPLRHSTPAAAV